ncbi:TlpA family protein disulfide reductase [Streptomyces coffeae]|uniref:TlpA family protein disulfide reductase n=1 Tax=Streptomyces coffeae TaxID=621382 RepID=A0ABS1N9X7_9ACTN|nr:TlpA disulfide reductase family protein [Streptomyces coffeae]MBL1096759.1 TlpA family protein disulfide reductase [Streptomyces coffeae]
MSIRHLLRHGVPLLAAALTLSACGGEGSGSTPSGSADSGGLSRISPDERKPLRLSGRTLEDTPLDTAAYRGEVVVVNIWASQCGPCRAEASGLTTVAEETRAKGVRFVGINTRDPSREAARAFEKKYDVPYPSLYDRMGKLVLAFPRGSVNPQAIPSTVFLDRKGRIAARALRPLSEADLRKVITPLAAEKRS